VQSNTKQSDHIEYQFEVVSLEPGTPEDEALQEQQLQSILDILLEDDRTDEGTRKDENRRRL